MLIFSAQSCANYLWNAPFLELTKGRCIRSLLYSGNRGTSVWLSFQNPSQSFLITDLHQNIQESGLISQNQQELNCISVLNTEEFAFHVRAENFKYQQNTTQTVRANQRSLLPLLFGFVPLFHIHQEYHN